MTLLGKIDKNVYRGDNYLINIVGVVPLIDVKDCIKFSSTTRTIKKIELPDHTVAPGPVTEAGEIELTFPAHSSNILLLDSLFNLVSNGIVPIASDRSVISRTQVSNDNTKSRTTVYTNCWILSKTEPDLEMNATDKMTEITYKFCYDASSDV